MTRRNVIIGIVVLVVLAGVIAVVAGGSGGDGSRSASGEYGTPAIAGEALSPYVGQADDDAVGRTAPQVEGTDFEGRAVTVGGEGPQLVLFVAHWCPHCQAEVPRIVSWHADGSLPRDVPIRTVATSTTAQRPNYPPSSWLRRQRWPFPVLADSASGLAGEAFGLRSFPYFVALDAGGKVTGRASGELSLDKLRALLATTAR